MEEEDSGAEDDAAQQGDGGIAPVVAWIPADGEHPLNDGIPVTEDKDKPQQGKMLTAAIEGKKLDLEQVAKPLSLREFMLHDHEEEPELRFLSLAITIDQHSKLLGKSIKDANIRENWSALVIGLERGAYTMTNPNVSLTFEKGDLLWILGKQKMMNTLIKEEVL